MPTIADNRRWSGYDWRHRGDEWSEPWGTTAHLWHGTILPRILAAVPCEHILEIAPGHGRCSQFLRWWCRRLSIVDLVEDCIQACRDRFGEGAGIEYHVNDGRTLPMIADASVDFAFSWDSLVHVEHDAIASYLAELARALRPGGLGFLHHSNLGGVAAERGRGPADEHARARSMTAARFAGSCRDVGLQCLAQELIPWGGTRPIDCFSFFQRPGPGRADARPFLETTTHAGFASEVANLRRLSELYAAPSADGTAAEAHPAGGIDLLDEHGSAEPGRAARRRVRLEGFHGAEGNGRWTDGHGVIHLVEPQADGTLSLKVAVYNPAGSRVRVGANGTLLAEMELPPGVHLRDVRVPSRASRIELDSDTFVPAKLSLGPDDRTLGVFVVGLRLR